MGIEQEFASEIRYLRWLARLSDSLHITGTLSAAATLDEFADFTASEFDFELEGRTADRLRLGLRPGAQVPRIRWDLTTRRVLSMEFIDGVTVLAICRLHESGDDEAIERLLPGVDLQDIISRIALQSFHDMFDIGFFHGDPHPANLLIRKDGSFVFVDCGIFGELSGEEQRDLRLYTELLVEGRFRQSARHYIRVCQPTPSSRLAELEDDLTDLLARWYAMLQDADTPIERRHISVWQAEVARLLRRHHVTTRRNLLLVWRAWMFLDSTALRMPGHFDVLAAQLRFFSERRRRMIFDRLLPEYVAKSIAASLPERAMLRRLSNPAPPALPARHFSREREQAAKRVKGLALALLAIAVALLAAGVPGETWIEASRWLASAWRSPAKAHTALRR
jgi:ubiquinone biosynthesis protein